MLWQIRSTRLPNPANPTWTTAGRSLSVLQTVHHGEWSYPHGQWAAAVVHRLAQQTVSGQPGRGCELGKTKAAFISASIWCRQHWDTFFLLFLLSLLAGNSEITSWCADSQRACARGGSLSHYACNNWLLDILRLAEVRDEHNTEIVAPF